MADDTLLDEYVRLPQRYIVSGGFDEDEGYKINIGRQFEKARRAVLAGDSNWPALVKTGFANNLVSWRIFRALHTWIDTKEDDALDAMQALWAEDDTPIPDRIRDFIPHVPEDPDHPTNFRGPGTRMRLISALLMALDPQKYPPFKTTEFKSAYEITGQDGPLPGSDAADMYEYALEFLDELIERAAALGFARPCNRLEAQSVVWSYRFPERFVSDLPDAAGERAS